MHQQRVHNAESECGQCRTRPRDVQHYDDRRAAWQQSLCHLIPVHELVALQGSQLAPARAVHSDEASAFSVLIT